MILVHLSIGLGRITWLTRAAADGEATRNLPTTSQHCQVRLSSAINAPLTWGVFRPVVLLPVAAATWREQDRRNALLHEFAHVERKDWLMQLLATLVCAVYWFNPLVWIARRQLILEAELAADDRVLASGSAPDEYAQQLITLTRMSRARGLPVAATSMAEHSLLRRRVRSILNAGEQRMPLTRFGKYSLLVIVAAAALLIGSARLVAAPQDDGATLDIPDNVATPLIRAAAGGDNDEVERLVQSGADVNEAWIDDGETLGEAPVDYNDARYRYQLERTPLTTAASHGHLDVVTTLLDTGARIDAITHGDATPLIAAAENDHFDVVRLLIERGADVNHTVRGDGSPLIAATRADNIDAMRLILDRGADPERYVRGDENPLFHAVSNGNAEAVQLLIDAGADVNQEWPGDGTPLLVATRSGDKATIDTLIRAGARADQGIEGDGNALIVAAQNGNNELLRAMLETGADANAAVEGDGSPLIQAARNGNMEGVVLLLQAGADIDRVVKGDENALIGAAWQGDIEIVDYLLKAGADPTIKARSYGEVRTALRQARLEGHDEVVRMLEAAGATE